MGISAALGGTRLPRLTAPSPLPASADLEEESSAPGKGASADRTDPRRAVLKGEMRGSPPSPPAAAPTGARPVAGRPVAAAVTEKPPNPITVLSRNATPAAVIQWIIDAATVAPALKGTRIRISLSPAHLGDLLIELTLNGSILQGKVLTETGEARDLIVSQLDQLRASLEGHGIQVGDFQVTVDGSRSPAVAFPDSGWGRDLEPPPGETCGPLSLRRSALDLMA